MTNRQVETSREIRLWITGILGPVVIAAGSVIANNPELAKAIVQKVKVKVKNFKEALKSNEEGRGS